MLRVRLDVMSHGELGPNACFPLYPFTQPPSPPPPPPFTHRFIKGAHAILVILHFIVSSYTKEKKTGERLVIIMIKINADDFHHTSPLAILPLPG